MKRTLWDFMVHGINGLLDFAGHWLNGINLSPQMSPALLGPGFEDFEKHFHINLRISEIYDDTPSDTNSSYDYEQEQRWKEEEERRKKEEEEARQKHERRQKIKQK